MNVHRHLLSALVLLGPALGTLPATPTESLPGASQPPGPTALQDTREEFRQRFRQAMDINATAEMAKLLKRNDHEAVVWIMEVCEAISERSSEDLETLSAAHRKAWFEAFESRFPVKVYEYFSLLEPELKRERFKLRERYDKSRARYIANLEKKHGPTFQLLANEFEGLADSFRELGDHFYSSECWVFNGLCYDEPNRGEDEDPYKTCAAYGTALAERDAIDLKDKSYQETRQRHSHLVAQGFGTAPGEGGDQGGPGAGGVAADEVVEAKTVALTFELVEKVGTYARPSYNADEFYQIWDAISIGSVGGEGKFLKLGELSPKVFRTADSEMKIDTDADGEGDLEFPFTGNLEPVSFEIGAGEERRSFGVLSIIGVQDDRYQEIQVNLAPSKENCTVYYWNAGSMLGAVEGTPVRIFDDDLNGIYGSLPQTWQNIGTSQEHYQPELDSIVIGDSKRALPWSEFQRIGDAWYRLEPKKGGKELAYTPTEVKTGFLKLKFKGPKPSYVVVQGQGTYENSYFDIAGASGKGAEVPIGKYDLFYGEVRKGKRRQMQKTVMIRGDEQTGWKVEEGKSTTVQLGGPFGFDFDYRLEGRNLTVTGASVVVVGAAGERYERPWQCLPLPQILWRKAGTRRALKGHTMKRLVDTEPIYEHGYGLAWSPLDRTELVTPGVDDIDVQLVEKKNRLFGKVESDWKD